MLYSRLTCIDSLKISELIRRWELELWQEWAQEEPKTSITVTDKYFKHQYSHVKLSSHILYSIVEYIQVVTHHNSRLGRFFCMVSPAVLSSKNRAKQDLWREAKRKTTTENWKAIKINSTEISYVLATYIQRNLFQSHSKILLTVAPHSRVSSLHPDQSHAADTSLS